MSEDFGGGLYLQRMRRNRSTENRETAIHPNDVLMKMARRLTYRPLPAPFANALLTRELRHLRQEHREQPERRQERANMIDKGNAGVVGDLAEHRGP